MSEQMIDHVSEDALTLERIEAAYADALDSLTYLRTMRDPRADIYETIVGLLRDRIDNPSA